jgi:hypothetical protein
LNLSGAIRIRMASFSLPLSKIGSREICGARAARRGWPE